MKICPNCKNQNEDAAMFCDNCGSPLGGGAPSAGVPPASNVPSASVPQAGGMPMGQPAMNVPAMGGGAAGGNLICPQCGTPNVPGTLYCDNCGADLRNVSVGGGAQVPAQPAWQPPQQVPQQQPQQPSWQPPQQPVQPSWQPQQAVPPAYVPAAMPTPPRIMAGGQPLMVPQKNEIIIGRSDVASGWAADVDLTPAGGTADQGVSRRHAKLTWQGQWMIQDMDSVNGTYLRGQKLVPNQKMPLSNGEVVQIGRVQITFYSS